MKPRLEINFFEACLFILLGALIVQILVGSNMFLLFLFSLICWRVSYMLTEEDGPKNIFLKLRFWFEDRRFPVLDCFYCTSVWSALVITLFSPNPLLYWLPISAVSIFIHLLHERMS